MINPAHPAKRAWDVVSMAAIVFSAVELPLRLSLGYPLEGLSLVLDRAVMAIFAADIVLNFNTGIYLKGKLEMSRRVIA